MKNKLLIKEMAKDKPVAAIQALVEILSEYAEENKIAHNEIKDSIKDIKDDISSVDGNGSCIISRLQGLEEGIKAIGEQPKDEVGEPIERRTEPSKKEKFKDLPIDRKVKTIVLCLTLVSLIGLLGASFMGFGEDIAKSFINNFIAK